MAAQASEASDRADALKLTHQAITVLDQIEQSPDRAIPQDLLRNAKAVAVIPSVVKAGFIFGGRHGTGLVSVRRSDGTWSYPVFVDMTGGSIGFQAGVSSTDVILVFRTERGVDGLVQGKFTLGANAAVAAGPVGRNAHASTDAQMHAEIYSYSRSRGLFAGVALDGTAITIDYDDLAAVYGAGITPRRVFEGGVTDVPASVKTFRDRLVGYAAPAQATSAAK
ncbi:MAG TPA: lipid-binding SYLF domain-containing protein [Rhodanobacteraceae bacterium]